MLSGVVSGDSGHLTGHRLGKVQPDREIRSSKAARMSSSGRSPSQDSTTVLSAAMSTVTGWYGTP